MQLRRSRLAAEVVTDELQALAAEWGVQLTDDALRSYRTVLAQHNPLDVAQAFRVVRERGRDRQNIMLPHVFTLVMRAKDAYRARTTATASKNNGPHAEAA